MYKKVLILILFALGAVAPSSAQTNFSHEIGAIVGPVNFRSDFGQRYDAKTNLKNTGIGFGIIHYMNFAYTADCNCYRPETYFNDHFKVRTELSYNTTKLRHYGKWADKQSVGGEQLRAMRGETSVTNIGMQLEYYPFSIRAFSYNNGGFAPFVSLGAQYSFFKPKVWSELGPLDRPGVLPQKYIGATSNDAGSTFSIVGSVGTRYKLSVSSDLMLDLRWQYFFSNWVDGVNPDHKIYPENKANDWLVWLNLGYIYYIN